MRTYESIQSTDLKTCAELFASVFSAPPWSEAWTVESAAGRLGEIMGTPGFIGMKVVSDDEITGLVMGYEETTVDGREFYIKEMCVRADRQGQGTGSGLLDALVKRLAADGVKKVYLLTARAGAAAAFYEKNGFYVSDKTVLMGRYL